MSASSLQRSSGFKVPCMVQALLVLVTLATLSCGCKSATNTKESAAKNPTASSPGAPNSVSVVEDWNHDRAELNQMDINFDKYRTQVLAYSASPQFASYRPGMSALLDLADELHGFARSHGETAVRNRSLEFVDYSQMESAAGADLQTLAEDIEHSTWVARDARQSIADAQDSIAPDLLKHYYADKSAIRTYGQSPAELTAIRTQASLHVEQAHISLRAGDELAALIAALNADLEDRYIAARLWEYHEQVYTPQTIAKFQREAEAASHSSQVK